jgi:hypothetical protein
VAVAEAIDRPLADPQLAARVGAAARERVKEEFLAIGRMLDYFRRLEILIDAS